MVTPLSRNAHTDVSGMATPFERNMQWNKSNQFLYILKIVLPSSVLNLMLHKEVPILLAFLLFVSYAINIKFNDR